MRRTLTLTWPCFPLNGCGQRLFLCYNLKVRMLSEENLHVKEME